MIKETRMIVKKTTSEVPIDEADEVGEVEDKVDGVDEGDEPTELDEIAIVDEAPEGPLKAPATLISAH